MSLSANLNAQIHASHQAGSDPLAKARAALAIEAHTDARARASAIVSLTTGEGALTALANATGNVTASTTLASTSAFLASARVSIDAGVNLTNLFGRGDSVTLPTLDVGVSIAALLAAEGDLMLDSDPIVRSAGPYLSALIEFGLTAQENSLSWGLGVALPFGADVALGGTSASLARERTLWATLSWAFRRETAR